MNVTPELAEEESCSGEFSHKTAYPKNALIVDVNRLQGGRLMSTTKEGKLLVNIVPGNEVYVVKEPGNFHDTLSAQNASTNENLVFKQESHLSTNSKRDDVEPRDVNNRCVSKALTSCYEYASPRGEIEYQNRERGINFSNDSNRNNDEQENPEYASKEPFKMWPGNDRRVDKLTEDELIGENQNTDLRILNQKTQGQTLDREESKSSYHSQTDYKSRGSIAESKPVSETNKSYATSINIDESSVIDGSALWTDPNGYDSQKDLCKSLPNLSFREDASSSLSQEYNFANALRPNPFLNYDTKFETKSELSIDSSAKQGRQETKRTHRGFTSHIDLPKATIVVPTSLTLRKVKITKIPPPLDLSRVNEKFEEVEAFERKQMYIVDVSLRRNHDCPLKGQTTVIREECLSVDNREDRNYTRTNSIQEPPSFHSNDRTKGTIIDPQNRVEKDDPSVCKQTKKEDSSGRRGLHKSCGDLSAAEDLQSPQLVNNYKNSMIDLRASGSSLNPEQSSQVAELEATQDRSGRSPLSDHVNSISSGPQAGSGSTLPSVYGPIPYSQ